MRARVLLRLVRLRKLVVEEDLFYFTFTEFLSPVHSNNFQVLIFAAS